MAFGTSDRDDNGTFRTSSRWRNQDIIGTIETRECLIHNRNSPSLSGPSTTGVVVTRSEIAMYNASACNVCSESVKAISPSTTCSRRTVAATG